MKIENCYGCGNVCRLKQEMFKTDYEIHYWIECSACTYRSPSQLFDDRAIAKHNLICSDHAKAEAGRRERKTNV